MSKLVQVQKMFLIKSIKKEKAILLIFLAALILRLLFLSPWLEDWDSVQFALALHDFDITKHQPHPPGYPLYIFIGKIINLFFNNDTLSLELLSSLLGAGVAIPFYLLARKIMDKSSSLLSTLLVTVTPVAWLLSETAHSNIPGLFFTVTTALLLYKGKDSESSFILGSFFAGITLGVRFAEYSILISLILLTIIFRKKWADLAKAGISFIAGLLVWLVPLILDTGLNEFIKVFIEQANYIARHDSLLSGRFPIYVRVLQLKELLVTAYSVYFLPVLVLIAWYLLKNPRALKTFNNLFVLTWLLAYAIPLFILYNLEDTLKYALPILPPLALLAGLGLKSINKSKLRSPVFVIVLLVILWTSFTKVKDLNTLIPATIAPVFYVKSEFNPANTVLITSFTYRQFQYYAPEFKNYFGEKMAPTKIDSKFVIIDFEGIKNSVEALKDYRLVDAKEFYAPKTLFPRISHTKLLILQR